MRFTYRALGLGAFVFAVGCSGSGGAGGQSAGVNPDTRPGGQPSVGAQPTSGETRPAGVGEGVGAGMGNRDWRATIANWPESARKAADMMNQKYGDPDEATETMLVWRDNGPWKKTVISNMETPHQFPAPHPDVMEQFISYRVPPDKFDELAAYDGSVTVKRTQGLLSARCDMEGANFLALNLAHEIITGKRSVEEARKFYGEQIMAMKAGQPAPYTEKLLFDPPGNAADPDQPLGM
jgi:hypothetical protein